MTAHATTHTHAPTDAAPATSPGAPPLAPGLLAVLRRELSGYFATPLGYIFICVFLLFAAYMTFAGELGGFFERRQADLRQFFFWHPILYLALIPAVSMRLWSEERRSGTIELLMTLPMPTWAAVLGKFLAAWLFAVLALALTFPIWITVAVLGEPDHGTIAAAYLASALMAGAYVALGSALSALTKTQTVAFVTSGLALFALTMAGFPGVQSLLEQLPGVGPALADTVSGLSTWARFTDLAKGVIALRDVVYFASLILTGVLANVLIIDLKKAD